MKKALESQSGFFPADAKPVIVLQPSDGSLDGPSSQRASVLGVGAICPVGSNHFDTLLGQAFIEFVAVVSFVADETGGAGNFIKIQAARGTA